MKVMLLAAGALLCAAPLMADTYSWTDQQGTVHFTEDYSRVPAKYRKKAGIRREVEQAQPENGAVDAVKSKPAVVPAEKPEEKVSEPEKSYGGKTLEMWRTELVAAQVELRRLDARVKELGAQLKATGEYTFRSELAQRYNDSVAEYNRASAAFDELVAAARKAGVNL